MFYIQEKKKNTPPYLYAFFEEDNDIMARVKVLDRHNTVGILKEICLFCELYDKNVSKYGREEEAIKRTLEECEERGILSAFIKEHPEEVEEIMSRMSQEKRINDFIDYSVKESRREGELLTLLNLVKKGYLPLDKAIEESGLKEEEFKEKLREL